MLYYFPGESQFLKLFRAGSSLGYYLQFIRLHCIQVLFLNDKTAAYGFYRQLLIFLEREFQHPQILFVLHNF